MYNTNFISHPKPPVIKWLKKPEQKSDIFSVCPHCGGMQIRGICQHCGYAAVCCVCGDVRNPAGEWHPVPRLISRTESHAYCPTCIQREYPEYWHKLNSGIGG